MRNNKILNPVRAEIVFEEKDYIYSSYSLVSGLPICFIGSFGERFERRRFVLFKIKSRMISHVGVYLSDGYFVQASSSRGVMISNLDEYYWKRYFFAGGRVQS